VMQRLLVLLVLVAGIEARLLHKRRASGSLSLGGTTSEPEVVIGDKHVPTLAPEPVVLDPATQHLANQFVADCLAYPPTILGFTNYRTEAFALEAVEAPLPGEIRANPLGKIAVFLPGFGSWPPSAAWVFRLAKYAERVVIAYEGTTKPELNTLIKAEKINGIDVPPTLIGKIFTIGDGENRAMISPDQGADLLIRYYSIMKTHQDLFAFEDPAFDLVEAQTTLIGHSEGTFGVVLARERLIAAGLPNIVGKLVTFGGGFGEFTQNEFGGLRSLYTWLNELDKFIGTNPDIGAYLQFVQDIIDGKWKGSDHIQSIDLGVGSIIGPKAGIHLIPPSIGADNNILPQFRLSAAGFKFIDFIEHPLTALEEYVRREDLPAITRSDGIIPLPLALAGRQTLELRDPHDHAGQIEDWGVVDDFAARL